MFIAIEGIDGSGKSVVLEACKSWFESKGLRCFDLRKHLEKNLKYPKKEEFLTFDTLLCEEPTHSSKGLRVRTHYISEESKKKPRDIAIAFAEDREELFKRAIHPMLNEGKAVVEERSLLSSLVYQGLQGMQWYEIFNLPGNREFLNCPPQIVLLADIDVNTAMERLLKRKKQDHAVFENQAFLREARETYRSERFRNFVESLNAKLITVDTSGEIKQTKGRVKGILEEFLVKSPA